MKLVRGAWKLLVGVKDALVLVAMLLFFGALFVALNARSRATTISEGALVLDLDGPIVEQPELVPPLALFTGQQVGRQYRLRDVLRSLDAARTDPRIKAVVLDLDRFGGAYPAALDEIATKLAAVRSAKKPVLAYATGYTDGGYRLAAAASEIWMDPQGGTLFAGPGGSQMFYKGLIDKLGVNAHVYRVGKFKSAVEPYTRADQSPEARAENVALYSGLFDQWRESVAKLRPQAQVAPMLAQPDAVVRAAGGDIAQANLRARLVDRLGDRVSFGRRVAQVVGGDGSKPAGWFKAVPFERWVAANPVPRTGTIGVLTVAGSIVDGEAGPGTAGGDSVSTLLYKGLSEQKLKALVVRIDSPGGSALASERIRLAVAEAKRRGIPVVVSMGGVAASGGYWIATAGDTIFAEPGTITGSIGVFGVIPTFENTLAKIGITTDGVRTTPLSGQPDVFGGTSDVFDRVIQASIGNSYVQFVGLVSRARKMTPARVNEIAQGRVWTGGAARQIGLVDRFGSLEEAIAEAARRAKVDAKDVVWLERKPGFAEEVAQQFTQPGDDEQGAAPRDAFTRLGWQRHQLFAQALGDARRLLEGSAVRADCLECAGLGPVTARGDDARLLDLVLARVGL